MRVALVHDWLTGMRGGESVLEAIVEIFPEAEIFTLIRIPEKISAPLGRLKSHTSWLQKIPNAEKRYRHFLPFMPSMIESFDLSPYDLVISSSHCVAKGVRKRKDAVHVSYVHAPMRYMWDRYDDYFGPTRTSLPVRLAARLLRKRLQNWDREVSRPERIDAILANSQFIAEQIRHHYQREATVVYPFVDYARFQNPRQPTAPYLMVTAFAPYKRIDLAIQAFNQTQLPLLIVGSGQDEKRLKQLAGPSIQFLNSLSHSAIADLYSKCRALIFPGVEDFGITPLECLAAGAPVIALKEGGATETVTPETGIFFYPQTVEALVEALQKMEKRSSESPAWPSENACRKRAAIFSKERFQKEFKASVQAAWVAAGKDPLTGPKDCG